MYNFHQHNTSNKNTDQCRPNATPVVGILTHVIMWQFVCHGNTGQSIGQKTGNQKVGKLAGVTNNETISCFSPLKLKCMLNILPRPTSFTYNANSCTRIQFWLERYSPYHSIPYSSVCLITQFLQILFFGIWCFLYRILLASEFIAKDGYYNHIIIFKNFTT